MKKFNFLTFFLVLSITIFFLQSCSKDEVVLNESSRDELLNESFQKATNSSSAFLAITNYSDNVQLDLLFNSENEINEKYFQDLKSQGKIHIGIEQFETVINQLLIDFNNLHELNPTDAELNSCIQYYLNMVSARSCSSQFNTCSAIAVAEFTASAVGCAAAAYLTAGILGGICAVGITAEYYQDMFACNSAYWACLDQE